MDTTNTFQWAVIGAGPAGIAAVGKLLDQGISGRDITWIDPHFTVGDFGTLWRNVPSNTKVALFNKYLNDCRAFKYNQCKENFSLHQLSPENTCSLSYMAEPLEWVTKQLRTDVVSIEGIAETLFLTDRHWQIQLKNKVVAAKQVILAMGAEPKNLPFTHPDIIPLSDAMDNELVKNHIKKNETIAVFGSSHSAILVLKNLVENGAEKIINFYRSPLLYAAYLKDMILFDDTGLKGLAADWARQNIDGNLPSGLQRVYSNKQNIEDMLPKCDKVIYATGFERRALPVVQQYGHDRYIEQVGIIAPGLFGLGIAFPEAKINSFGMTEHRVGLWKFMDYLNSVLPIWLKYSA